MSDENQDMSVTEVEIDYKNEYTKLAEEKAKLIAKNQELIGEKQREAEKRRNAEQLAESERLEKAKKDGDYESVIKSAQQKEQEWQQKFTELNNKITQKEVRNAAIRLANELNPLDGDSAETLADYIEKRIRYNDNGFCYLDAQGNPSVMDAGALKEEFANSNKFKPLLKGLQANGGGAPGAKTLAKNEISRADFEKLPQDTRRQFLSNGGKLI